uniref:(northern house mosquito) hypothetical protein n=1 Tax=Culex pipiens TaxID=7175 RepID=A0A8D8EUM9_CULPI
MRTATTAAATWSWTRPGTKRTTPTRRRKWPPPALRTAIPSWRDNIWHRRVKATKARRRRVTPVTTTLHHCLHSQQPHHNSPHSRRTTTTDNSNLRRHSICFSRTHTHKTAPFL